MKKPQTRSRTRLLVGGIYFLIKKHIYWVFSGNKFAKEKQKNNLEYEVFKHQTLLLRPLKNVEMWMQYNKIQNLRLAIEKLDGLILKPKEIFSYWLLIGLPTKSKGYLPGMLLRNGELRPGIGGGLCQLSNLIYWITLHSPLTVIERWRHSYDVFPDVNRTQPFGSGATCSYPNIDLQIANKTEAFFQLRLELTETHLVGRWLSSESAINRYEIEERDCSIQQQWWGGYTRHNRIFKIAYSLENKLKISEELVAENSAIMMYEPLLGSLGCKQIPFDLSK